MTQRQQSYKALIDSACRSRVAELLVCLSLLSISLISQEILSDVQLTFFLSVGASDLSRGVALMYKNIRIVMHVRIVCVQKPCTRLGFIIDHCSKVQLYLQLEAVVQTEGGWKAWLFLKNKIFIYSLALNFCKYTFHQNSTVVRDAPKSLVVPQWSIAKAKPVQWTFDFGNNFLRKISGSNKNRSTLKILPRGHIRLLSTFLTSVGHWRCFLFE